MTNKPFAKAAGTVCAIAILVGSLSGCGAAETQTQSTTPVQQSETTPAQQTTTTTGSQTTGQSTQQPAATGQQQPSKSPDMTAVLTRAAEILGVSSDKFIAAFESARPQGGPSDNGTQGQPPAPPSGQQQGEPPAAPTGQQGEQPTTPPSGQQQRQPGNEFMTEIYTKMATELNISADKIEAAITQAQQELSK